MKDRLKNSGLVFPICLAVMWSISFGCALKNRALGISLGLCFALPFWIANKSGANKNDDYIKGENAENEDDK